MPTKWIVQGKRWVPPTDKQPEGAWEKFEETYSGADKAEARWDARRAQAPGKVVTKLEETPPNAERLNADLDAGLRGTPRTESESSEYDRLVQNVQIDSVELA